ncbi:hypothetical protein ABB37_09064 [Leptomonas pyrrhocoris]|uniref:Uncharacterized protein n=1 Tax=Leptomonas pyrrhocoris TaxID=157538 RepID=A0A0N0VD67_LEPPY|nr:hypothetical protein ABB37_09064 [Leptomonas pyrrhocoris]XP_015653218.1 hypothetical protein ABB37_09064 [Leptomonas pyrrhocoris]XP_015653219.1 hypothetical protein ABB37_09064 [Leptomonas pyrrhocoris]KPA74778.1 hypothetical protein ABB37_09064 [Leptomonas pyrrhocoris]KPA74779.1 hypothetical protein ABB37_09064 [Leptomonas pyrrhocoris]KPA74780.1 hypothetical protein ABB37_09064 [Leptomonas pyrrhocoris]|eukprot:XP_015653217.1 hypothetical protein ABB37_09064 [Leptomonas pyrrhocoris]
MRLFLGFELVVGLLCGLAVLLCTEGPSFFLTTSLPRDTITVTSPDVHLALYWLRRSLTQPYRGWYLHDAASYDTVGVAGRLPPSVVEQGRVLLPLHVLYLRLSGEWLRWTQPDLVRRLLPNSDDGNGLADGRYADALRVQQAIATVAAGCVVLIGAPGSWCFMRAVSQLLTRAARERVRVARMQLPASASSSPSSSSSPPATEDAEGARGVKGKVKAAPIQVEEEDATPPSVHDAAVFFGALVIVGAGLLPLLLLEVCTLQPWCLVGSLVIWAVYAVLRDELQLHPRESDMSDDPFDLASPVMQEGAVVVYPLKRQPSVVPLASYVVIATFTSLSLTSCLYITPLLFLWALTSCWQHGSRRVLVKVKASAADTASTTAVTSDRSGGYVRVGYSSYTDKSHMNACFCCASMSSVLTVLLLTTPWWWRQQPLLAFMDLFAGPPLPTAAHQSRQNHSSSLEGLMGRSFTGAREMQARCLSGPSPSYLSCALPAANAWQLSEWFGLPWTHAAQALTQLFAIEDDYVHRESARWLEFATVVMVVLGNAASVLTLTFYRIRKPPLTFETPVRYAAERAAHQAEQHAYWEAKRLSRRGGGGRSGASRGSAPPPAAPPSSTSAAADGSEGKRAKVVTCLCREEYVVKQVVLLSWMLSLAILSGTALFMRNGPASGVLALPCSSLLAAVYVVASVLRRAHPLAFCPLPSSSTTAGRKAEGTQQHNDPSALTQQDGDDPRPLPASRWCTSAVAPSLVHAADVTWLQMIFVASVLSTGALSWTVIPTVVRQMVIGVGSGGVALSLWRLRRWASLDLSSSVLFTCGGVASVCLWLLLTVQLLPPSGSFASSSSHLYTFTSRFGNMHASTGEAALRAFIYQCAVACGIYVSCIIYASLRVGRLALEPEEVRLVPIESELSFFSRPAESKKQR